MSKQQACQRIEKLKKLINHHRYLYHVLDKEEISAQVLDSLKKELFDLEQKYPEFVSFDSPTQRVGGKALKKFEKVLHPEPMLSFNDAFSEHEVQAWLKRNLKLLNLLEREVVDFYCEPKLDGLAIELIYKKGFFRIGATRGDGLIGENVTQNLKTIEAIPLQLRNIKNVVKELKKENLGELADKVAKQGLKEIVVRGEVMITKKRFQEINQERRRQNLECYANPRNIAAGSIRQLNPKITASRHLDSNIYDLKTDLGQITHLETHQILKALGFKTSNRYNKYCQSLKQVFEYHNDWQKNREKFSYEIDGIVIMVNSNKIFNKLGTVGKAPRGAIAYKFPLQQSETIIEDIKIQIGRTGALTPVACLKPVNIAGVTITRATLHNIDQIKRLGIKIGDTVIVGRAGDVIPAVIKVLKELRTGREKQFVMPKKCPICATLLIRKRQGVVWHCPNSDCLARQTRHLNHFVSKKAFDIDGLGPRIIEQLIDAGLISDSADLFKLKKGDIISLQGFAEKSAENLISSIKSKKNISLEKFLYALGIDGVGEETAVLLANHFQNLENIKNAELGELQEIKDIGPETANSIYSFFLNKKKISLIEQLIRKWVKITQNDKKYKDKFKKKIFVLTGSLDNLTREEAKNKVRELGGKISNSVSDKTDFLIIGKKPGSKLNKAKKLGVKIIEEKQFLDFYG